jgi:copper transport protein
MRPARALATKLCALFLLLPMLLWAPAAAAHAALIASDPPNEAVLHNAPREASLSFDETVAPLVFKIAQPDGTLIEPQRVTAEQDGIVLTLPPLTQQGTYALSWRVISADGHPVGGSQLFSIGTASARADTAHVTPTRDVLIWLARLAWFTGLLAGVGMSSFRAFGSRSPTAMLRGGYGVLLGTGAIAALASLGLLGVDALDAPLASLLDASTWRTAMATSFALSCLFSWIALGLAALSCRSAGGRTRQFLAAIALVALGLALASSGHASTAPPMWVARPAVWLHAVAATAWIGSLVPLARSLGKTTELGALRRFSRIIPGVLFALIASGVVIISLQFDHLASLWRTPYGQVLIAKLMLVASLLALGAHNRFGLTARVLAGEAAARRALRRSIMMECVLALAVLAVVSLWRFTPPPRALDAAHSHTAQARPLISIHIHTRDAMAQVVLEAPAGTSTQTLALYLYTGDLTSLHAKEVSVAFFSEEAGLEPIRYAAHQKTDGSWRVDAIHLPRLGHCQIEIDALVSDFERIRLRTRLESTP